MICSSPGMSAYDKILRWQFLSGHHHQTCAIVKQNLQNKIEIKLQYSTCLKNICLGRKFVIKFAFCYRQYQLSILKGTQLIKTLSQKKKNTKTGTNLSNFPCCTNSFHRIFAVMSHDKSVKILVQYLVGLEGDLATTASTWSRSTIVTLVSDAIRKLCFVANFTYGALVAILTWLDLCFLLFC